MRIPFSGGLVLLGLGASASGAAGHGTCSAGACRGEVLAGVSLIQTKHSKHHKVSAGKAEDKREGVGKPRGRSRDVAALAVGGQGSPDNSRGDWSSSIFGSLACMTWTGGTCNLMGCRSNRGSTRCVDGRCMCRPNYCANAYGTCDDAPGKWLGEYSIQFHKPYEPAKSYLGVGGAGLKAMGDSAHTWWIALTHLGFVRFESMRMPGEVLTIYNNRRRRQPTVAVSLSQVDKTSGDDNDLWPTTEPLETVSPLDATFLIRKTGDGFEIWDPQRDVAIANANPAGWFQDHVADRGVAECSNSFFGLVDGCKGRQVVTFSPELPVEAVSSQGRIHVNALSGFTWWQLCLFLIGGICLCCCCCYQMGKHQTKLESGRVA